MAKRLAPARPARTRARDDDTILIRSAESLGRVIGSLRRKVLGGTVATAPSTAHESEPPARRRTPGTRGRKTAASPARKTPVRRKTKTTAPRKAKQR